MQKALLVHLAVIAASTALVGCGSIPTGEVIQTAGAQPTKEQAETAIRTHLRRTLRDPDSLRDFAMLSGPTLTTGTTAGGNLEQVWLVCVEYNAKNAYGGYTGISTESYPLRFSGDSLTIISRINWVGQDKHC